VAVTTLDQVIGQNIRRYRLLRGFTLEALSAAIGMKYQQIRKFEVGIDRISASQLHAVSGALRIPIANFFRPPKHQARC
jgi:transcriptional regulator with XRE-family HTH domain